MGLSPEKAAKHLIDTLALAWDVDEFLALSNAALFEAMQKVQPIPGAEKIIELSLMLPHGAAIATSSTRQLFEAKAEVCPFLRKIPSVVCADDEGLIDSKPAPDIYLKAMRAIGVSAERTLVFEDSPAGAQAARSAKVKKIIGILHPKMPIKKLHLCDRLIADFNQLLF